jgi:hypothetical protein
MEASMWQVDKLTVHRCIYDPGLNQVEVEFDWEGGWGPPEDLHDYLSLVWHDAPGHVVSRLEYGLLPGTYTRTYSGGAYPLYAIGFFVSREYGGSGGGILLITRDEMGEAALYNVRVTVVDAETGSPVPGALVQIDGSVGYTGSSGVATLSAQEGAYTIRASASGYLDSDPVEQNVTGDTEVEIALTPTGVVPLPTLPIMEMLLPVLVLWVIGGIIFALTGGGK